MPPGHEVDAESSGHTVAASVAALFRLGAIILALAALLPIHLLFFRGREQPSPVARLFVRIARRLLGLRVAFQGAAPARGAVLYVSNHVSWADIFVLGSLLPVSFVAKAEVGRWPMLGWLVRQHGTIFVDRTRRTKAGEQSDAIAARLRLANAVLLFPEGTSSDGRAVLPFRSALFASAVAAEARVQPVSIVWTRVGGRALDEANRRTIAWIDDMELLPHIWALLRAGGAEALVTCHPFLPAGDRRTLAEASRALVVQGLESALRSGAA
ncbi:MAG TPA: lysophospholipid acyltransferase family protein [Allosphingosinicella sp.]|nr:lysophospholipid acyltransferase family protein [Allosphingosinicella sp.]